MVEQGGLSRKQKMFLGVMTVTILGVLIGLTSVLRKSPAVSPLATSVLPRATSTAVLRLAITPSSTAPIANESSPSGIVVPADVQAARKIEALGRDVGKTRELPKKQEIPLNFLSQEDLASYLRSLRADTARNETVQRQLALLAALDLVPDSEQAFPPTVLTRARQLVGFYDPLGKQIFVGTEAVSVEEPDISLVHQYAHAVIDQHFYLITLTRDTPNADEARARDALWEGDAVAVLAIHTLGGVENADLDELSSHLVEVELTDYEGFLTTRAMNEVYLFPYREGARFVATLLRSGWWPSVNAAYLDPPVSTEQILHPEKYIDSPRDLPRTVSVPDLAEDLGEGWRLVTQDVMGELVLRAHLDQYLPDTADAVAAAAGWDGDLAVLWTNADGGEVLVMRILWDSVREATEFLRIYTTLVELRLGGAQVVVRPVLAPGGRWRRGEGGDAYLQRNQDEVLIVWAPDADTMERVLSVFLFVED